MLRHATSRASRTGSRRREAPTQHSSSSSSSKRYQPRCDLKLSLVRQQAALQEVSGGHGGGRGEPVSTSALYTSQSPTRKALVYTAADISCIVTLSASGLELGVHLLHTKSVMKPLLPQQLLLIITQVVLWQM